VKTVTYRGPSGYFLVRVGAEKVKLPAGAAVELPEDAADSLSEVEGHDFEIPGSTSLDDADSSGENAGELPECGDDDEHEIEPIGSTN
jgi:hypothetical protein